MRGLNTGEVLNVLLTSAVRVSPSMLQRPVAERPARTRLESSRPRPALSAALQNLLDIAGPDWATSLHTDKSISTTTTNFQEQFAHLIYIDNCLIS